MKIKLPNIPLTLQSSKVTLLSVQDLNLTVLCTLTLSVTFAPNLQSFNVQFYVIKKICMPCDGLLGLDSLVLHNIGVFQNRHALSRHERFHPAMAVSVPLLSIASLAASLDSISTLSPVMGIVRPPSRGLSLLSSVRTNILALVPLPDSQCAFMTLLSAVQCCLSQTV